MDLWVFRSDYHHCSTGNEITPEEVRGMTDEQKQAAMKFVDAYTELRTAFDTDDYEHEIDNIVSALYLIAPDPKEDGDRFEWCFCAASVIRDGCDTYFYLEKKVEDLKKEVEDLKFFDETHKGMLASNDIEIENLRQQHESTLSQIQIYIAELEAKNGSLQTELRYLKARLLQQKNSDLDRKLKSIIFKCHPDKWEDHPLATEVVKDLNELRQDLMTK